MRQNNVLKRLLVPIGWYVFILGIAFVGLVLFIRFKGVYIGPGVNDFILPLGNSSYELSKASTKHVCIYKHVNDDIDHKKEVIVPTVQQMGYDNNFIIIKQKPLQPPNNENHIQYWIIDMNKKLEYGPFNENEFNSRKLELKVDTNLKLKDVHTYCNDKN